MRLTKIRDIILTLVIIIGLAIIIHWLNKGEGRNNSQDVGETISGKARIIDADSFFIGNDEIRLFGIDAPEGKQYCASKSDQKYPCGRRASQALKNHLGNRPITCKVRTRDRYGRAVSICYLGNKDLNDWIVRQGHATAYRKYSLFYVEAEKEAKEKARGIWQGTFLSPSQWRQLNNPHSF